MATQTQTTRTTTDGDAPERPRRLAWVFEHSWLIAGSLLVLMLVPAEADKAESEVMAANRDRIAAMSRSERQRVEFNFAEYRKLTGQQRHDVKALHSDIEQDAELADTLTAWHQWLAGLDFEDRENILQTTDPAARLALVRELVGAQGAPVDFGGDPLPPSEMPRTDQNFRLPYAATEFHAMIRVIAEYLKMPDHAQEDTLAGRLKYHASVIAELLLSIRRNSGQSGLPVRPGDRVRMTFPPELRQQMIDALPDPARRRTIAQQDEVEQQRSLAQLVVTGFYREMQIAMQQLKPADDMLLALYLDLPQVQRDELDQLPEEQFARRLDELWLERQFPELARHVREIRRLMPARINQRPVFQQNGNRLLPQGFRPNGASQNRPNGQ